jgi:SEC-C motif domain protein
MSLCPCCSALPFDQCCGPILEGAVKAATPERVMRARYTAYARVDTNYLVASLHPDAREGFDVESARQWAEGAEWQGLEIVACSGGEPNADEGSVEFIARYRVKAQDQVQEHHELAQFAKQGGEWFFVDGAMVAPQPFVRDAPKVGRNDPCSCGSGRKYKKCCGR